MMILYLSRIVATRAHRTAQARALIIGQLARQQRNGAQVETDLEIRRKVLELDLDAGGGGGSGRVGRAESDLIGINKTQMCE